MAVDYSQAWYLVGALALFPLVVYAVAAGWVRILDRPTKREQEWECYHCGARWFATPGPLWCPGCCADYRPLRVGIDVPAPSEFEVHGVGSELVPSAPLDAEAAGQLGNLPAGIAGRTRFPKGVLPCVEVDGGSPAVIAELGPVVRSSQCAALIHPFVEGPVLADEPGHPRPRADAEVVAESVLMARDEPKLEWAHGFFVQPDVLIHAGQTSADDVGPAPCVVDGDGFGIGDAAGPRPVE